MRTLQCRTARNQTCSKWRKFPFIKCIYCLSEDRLRGRYIFSGRSVILNTLLKPAFVSSSLKSRFNLN